MFKKISFIGAFALLVLLFAAAPASAHNGAILAGDNITDAMEADFNNYMFPEGTTQSFILIRGHGFEYSFGNLTDPFEITITAPDGTISTVTTKPLTEDIDNNLAGTMVPLTSQVFDFTFTQKGTYFLSTSFPGNTTEYVKTAVFVGDGTWDDWNKNLGLPLEFTMYTRMSGLAEGEVVYGKLNYKNGSAVSDTKYYVEPLKSAVKAAKLRDFITANYPTGEDLELVYSKRASTDEFGHFVSSIPEQGVWTFVASAEADGKPSKATYTFPVLPQFYGTDTTYNGYPGHNGYNGNGYASSSASSSSNADASASANSFK